MENETAEQKANESKAEEVLVQQAQTADVQAKLTLKIWDVPHGLGNRFIDNAKARYGGKSWLYLKALVDGEMTSELLRTKLDLQESRLKNIEGMLSAILEAPEEKEEEKPKAPAVIKTFGGGRMERKE